MKTISNIIILFFVASSAIAQPTLYLYSQQSEENTLIPGQPLTLKLQLYDHDMETAYMNQVSDQAYLEELEEALENGEITDTVFLEEKTLLIGKPVTSYSAGSDSGPWYGQVMWQFFSNGSWQNYPFPIPFLPGLDIPKQLEISGLSRNEAPFGIVPGETEKMTATDYKFRVGMLSSNFSTTVEKDTIWSNHLNIKTTGSKGGYPDWSVLEKQYDLVFWYYKGDYDIVISKADGLIANDTTDIHSIMYKADALAAKGQLEEAAEWFDKGIQAYDAKFPDAYEPPAYMIERYNEIIGILLDN